MTTSARVPARDLGAQVFEVRQPVRRGIGAVIPGQRADFRQNRGVQRIGRRRHQHLVALVDERAQRQLDAFRRARRDEDAIRRHVHTPGPVVVGDGLAGRRDAGRGQVAVVAVAHRPGHGLDQVRRGREAERHGIPDIQVADPRAASLDGLRLRHDVADGVGEPVHARGDRYGPRGFGRHSLILRRRASVVLRVGIRRPKLLHGRQTRKCKIYSLLSHPPAGRPAPTTVNH